MDFNEEAGQTCGSERLIADIVQQCGEDGYHERITSGRSYEAMYQLAETRGNVVEWLRLPEEARVLEIGAGCGAVTSVLLKKKLYVTALDENEFYCSMNRKRHEGEGRLEIMAQAYADCEDRLRRDYDCIFLLGGLEVLDAPRLLESLRGHLRAGGMLVLAAENKFGLRYWAGCKEEQSGKYFGGLDGSAAGAGVRLYTRRGLGDLLAESGYVQTEFYYPYPDHRFARDIYSDAYLPEKGGLSYNIVNYEDDRLILFDEQKVYDSIIAEGQYPLFANSFLCLSRRPKEGGGRYGAQPAVYTRYASDRAREYAVRTDIVPRGSAGASGAESTPRGSAGASGAESTLCGSAGAPGAESALRGRAGSYVVRKYPVYREGAGHIAHMADAYVRLESQYRDSGLRFNRCRPVTEGGVPCAEFEFIDGSSLQNEIEDAAAGHNMKKVFDILARMVQYIRSDCNTRPFSMTEEFVRVFGAAEPGLLPPDAPCSAVSDIDLVLPNILVDGNGTWNVIDYEWTFFFPVPQNFMIYRTLFFLNHENPDNSGLSMEKLLSFAGITEREASAYALMEENFQKFVTGGLVPYREMVNVLQRKFFRVEELKADYDRLAAQNEMLKGRGIWKIARAIKNKLLKS